jgi:exonuclease SbcC
MKPIRLEVENFTVYRGRYTIDFSPLNFFAIRGRTGAGKSSIIDAISYALFGKVPRFGREDRIGSHLLSEGEKSMRVCLEFSVKGKLFRIEREYRQHKGKGSGDFRFYEEGKSKALKATELESYITQLLGLDYETFTKVIVLPQNQFDRLLRHSGQREGRRILNTLLGFSKMFQKAKEILSDEHGKLETRAQYLRERLNSLRDYSEDLIRELENSILKLDEEYGKLLEDKGIILNRLEGCRERDKLMEEMLQCQESLKEFRTMEEEIEKKKNMLTRAKEIFPYLQDIRKYEDLKLQEESLKRQRNEVELKLSRIKEDRIILEEEYRRWEEEYKKQDLYRQELTDLRLALEAIDSYLGKQKELISLKRDMAELQEALKEKEIEYKDKEERLKRGREEIEQIGRSIEELREENIEERLRRLERQRELAKERNRLKNEILQKERELNSSRREIEELNAYMERLNHKKEQAENSIREIQGRISQLKERIAKEGDLKEELFKLTELIKRIEELRALNEEEETIKLKIYQIGQRMDMLQEKMKELEKRRKEVYAWEIRKDLKPGDLCPVCGSPIETHEDREEKEEDLEGLIRDMKGLEDEINRLKVELLSQESIMDRLREEKDKLHKALGNIQSQEVEREYERVRGELSSIEELKRESALWEGELQKLTSSLEEISKSLEGVKIKASSSEARMEALEAERASLLNRLAELTEQVGKELWEIEEEIRELEEKSRRYKELTHRKERYENRYVQLQEEKELIRRERDVLREKIRGKEENLKRLEEELLKEQKKIGHLCGELREDIKDLKGEVIERMESIDRFIREVEEKYQLAMNKLNSLTTEELVLQSRLVDMDRALEDVFSKRVHIAPRIYHIERLLGGLENIREYMLDWEEIERLQAGVQEYERRKGELEERLRTVEEKLRQYEELPPTEEIEREVSLFEEQVLKNRQERTRFEVQLLEARKALEEKSNLQKELYKVEGELSLYGILKTDLRDDRFPEHVSQIMLERIADRASYYLFRFTSGIYRFETVDGELKVLNLQSGHSRVISSLSGGETFLASLSLAFAVADLLSHNAPLESLFIDEGFGSLDRETRESLGDFFELVRQSTDRMVGIITHVEDIAEKFSQRIEVEKIGGRAQIRVIY